MIKKNNHQSEGLTYVILKVDMKLKCKNLITGSVPQALTVWLAVIYSFETVISIEHVIIKQELQDTR